MVNKLMQPNKICPVWLFAQCLVIMFRVNKDRISSHGKVMSLQWESTSSELYFKGSQIREHFDGSEY